VSNKSWRCGSCDFIWYQNTAAAAAAMIVHAGDILMAVRAGAPQAGRLDLPGGFVDNDETAETSLLRELDEELGLRDVTPRYLTSFPNTYLYAGVEYKTLDLIYLVELQRRPELHPADDVADVRWTAIDAVPFEEIAFDSVRRALRYLRANRASLVSGSAR
jgi:ADP-ribose pyrophosphatase YjhB (NUDIX family)